MKVKKFTGRDMPDAMKKVRQELGDHAVILTSKTVSTGGFLGLFSRKSIQVIAAVDEEHPSTPVTARSKTREKEPGTYKNESLQESDLEKEVSEIKETLHHLKKDSLLSSSDHPLPLIKVDNALQDHEVEHYIRQETRNTLLMEWYRSEAPDTSSIKKKTKHVLKNAMKGIEFGHSFPPKKFIHLVGPTGVGKTTTLAKIAAHYQLNHKLSIGFITTDTYRIAAVEQLKTYAKILDVPIEVVYSLEDFKRAKQKFVEKDVVFIDSAGRNYQNSLYVDQLNEVIEFDDDMETFLVLSLTSKYKDMKYIYQQFSKIPIDKFIFTKYDETSSYGAILNLVVESRIGAAYVTNGQNVPDDIEVCDPDQMIDWLLAGVTENE